MIASHEYFCLLTITMRSFADLMRRVRHFVWGEVPATKQEQILLLKIDWFILSYCCLMVRAIICSVLRHQRLSCVLSSHSILRIVRKSLNLSMNRFEIHELRMIPVDLDRSNVSNAYVSGMKEELNMQGNQFNVSYLLNFFGLIDP